MPEMTQGVTSLAFTSSFWSRTPLLRGLRNTSRRVGGTALIFWPSMFAVKEGSESVATSSSFRSFST